MTPVKALMTSSVLVLVVAAGGSRLGAQAAKTAPAAQAPAAKTPAAAAPAAAQTPTEAYMAYRAAFDKATKMDDIKPFQSKKVRAEMDAQKPADAADFFKMIKSMSTMTSVKVVKETLTHTGATLMVDAVNPQKVKMACEVTLVKEGGAWKIANENWSAK